MDQSIPDVFADVVDLAGGSYGLALSFRRTDPTRPGDAEAATTVARVRLTPALAQTLAVILGQAAQQSAGTAPAESASAG